MQPIPVLDYAPSKASPLRALYRGLRLPALVLAVGLLGGLLGHLLEPPTFKASGYLQIDFTGPDVHALEIVKRTEVKWLREIATPATAIDHVRVDPVPESKLIVVHATDRNPRRAADKVNQTLDQTLRRPGLTVAVRAVVPNEGTRSFLYAGVGFIVAVLVAVVLLLLLRRRPDRADGGN